MPSKYKRKSLLKEPFKKIVIAMEGTKKEPNYFSAVKKTYRTTSLDIVLLKREDTVSAPKHVIKELHKFKKENKLNYNDELWLVIDKDRWPEVQLSQVSADCSTNGYFLALSNPRFELWLLLHFKMCHPYLIQKKKSYLKIIISSNC